MESTTLLPLDELVAKGDSGDTKLTVFMGNNLGYPTLETKLPIYDLFRLSDVANERGPDNDGSVVAQRKLDPVHARGLALYTLKGLIKAAIRERAKCGKPITEAHQRIQRILGVQPYLSLQPIVANLRTAGPGGSSIRGEVVKAANGDVVGYRFWLSQRDILWVVDGQHRRMGLEFVFKFLDDVRLHQKYPPKKQSLYMFDGEDRSVPPDELNVWLECLEVARGICTVALEIHLGLSIEEERQLFHDLNNLAKKVERSLALEFDMANPVNAFLRTELIEKQRIAVTNTDSKDWEGDSGEMTRKELVAVNAQLILNKTNVSSATPTLVEGKLEVAKRFWEAVLASPNFGEPGAKRQTVLAQPVVLKALAKLVYDFAFGRQRNNDHLEAVLDGITDIDFSHENPMWRYYDLSDAERAQHGLEGLTDYLPASDEGKNRDIGAFDSVKGWMRFGPKHNDIFPILGDMIRWKLGLPNRHDRESVAIAAHP
ncbi:MAG TPA: DNA sulfur modification protein DndB [Terriglobales bacterium]|nr:DNA sulfur modification protein DndB [Terriglobales bacterium]